MQTRWLWSLVLLLLFAPVLVAQDGKEEQKAEEEVQSVQDKFQELVAAHRQMSVDYRSAVRAAETNEDRMAAAAQQEETTTQLLEQAHNLLQEAKGDDEASVQILMFVANSFPTAKEKAIEALMTHHIESEAIGALTSSISRGMPTPANEKLLRRLAEESPHDSVKGQAIMSLANFLSTMKQLAGMPEETRNRYAAQMGEGGAEFIAKWTEEAIDAETLRLLEEAAEKYADVKYGRSTIGKEAETQLFVIKYLSIGKVAPDIEGEDIDGEVFKLSDYRGKVVVIDFWGDW